MNGIELASYYVNITEDYVMNVNNVSTGLKRGNDTDDGTCKQLSKSDYIYLVWTTCAEFPGQLLPIF